MTGADVSVLVTGAGGYLGRQFVPALVEAGVTHVVALDVREIPEAERVSGVTYRVGDVRDAGIVDVLREFAVTSVVHPATIVTPPKGSTRELEHSIDVLGTQNVTAEIDKYTTATTGALHCVGTWHSHLNEFGPSGRDRQTARTIAEKRVAPSVLLIRTPGGYRALATTEAGLPATLATIRKAS